MRLLLYRQILTSALQLNEVEWAEEFVAKYSDKLPDTIRENMTKYANASKYKGADITDVALVFLGARLKTNNIFTVDIEDFETYKTLSGKNFTRLWM